ncbi:DUF3093 domain-containing protein [Mycobacterium shimoidei]|uniref:DUF3093 domain-containing protein n=1 Tax=Mycobacterium shimoidei TaxID=29313 RepID=A0A1E3TDM7_MYCSH|nr:DUF3093 domain-containing protein [Mycobacterium shimoidei]MCV7260458.1 DUF3093 domain-containing protein [Mycobacterium shimoidei]ODR12532.1 DUF3093 domain-containing protein [Mycobacterium shimoidei]ORW80804.1 hypothetical protein AWC26_10025 [Mycobacterium shimoidei]SRX92239.1 hypothetical protein MSP7336_00464 [Mycobacterium shimoidei]
MTTDTDTKQAPLFREVGASWYWVLTGPLSAAAMLLIEHSGGYGWQPLVPGFFLVIVSAFVALQVKAARIHTSVELTPQTLRQGTETIKVADIVRVYPEADNPLATEKELERWQSARALGELTGVPKGRVGIGLRLTGGRHAQAWARRHRLLRAALTPLVEERVETVPEPEVDDDDDAGSRW